MVLIYDLYVSTQSHPINMYISIFLWKSFNLLLKSSSFLAKSHEAKAIMSISIPKKVTLWLFSQLVAFQDHL